MSRRRRCRRRRIFTVQERFPVVYTHTHAYGNYNTTFPLNSLFSDRISLILRRFFRVRERHVVVVVTAAAVAVSTRVNVSHAYRSAAAVDAAAIRPFGIGASRPVLRSPPMVMFANYRFYDTLGPHSTVGQLLLFCHLYDHHPHVRMCRYNDIFVVR